MKIVRKEEKGGKIVTQNNIAYYVPDELKNESKNVYKLQI